MDYMAGKREAKQRWLLMELLKARLRGETVHVALPEGVFIVTPDGTWKKADNRRGMRHARIPRLD